MIDNTYYRRKEAGLCPRCGEKSARPGRVYCEACSRRAYEEKTAIKQRRKDAGKCVWCERPTRPGKRMCLPCSIRAAGYSKKYYQENTKKELKNGTENTKYYR